MRYAIIVLVTFLWLCAASGADAKYIGPDTARMSRVADVVAVVRVTWVTPADSPDDRRLGLFSRVSAKVIRHVKGRLDLSELVIGTDLDMEKGCTGCYCPGHSYLVFLVRRGPVYRTAYGQSGVFELSGTKIQGWPERGHPAYPKPERAVEYSTVIKEMLAYFPASRHVVESNPPTPPAATRPATAYRGPAVKELARVATAIALVRVVWVLPPAKPTASAPEESSRVVVSTLEVLKGTLGRTKLTILTNGSPGKGGYESYCPEKLYLVFLTRENGAYRAAYGRAGVFEKVGYKIRGWPKPGALSYPRSEAMVDYKQVRKEIAKEFRR